MEDWNMGGLEYGSIGVLRLKDWALQLAFNLPPIQPSNLPFFQSSITPSLRLLAHQEFVDLVR